MALYKDIDFNFKKDDTLGFSFKEEEASINQSISNILNTIKGERLWDPRFGSNIHSFLFEKISPLTSSLIQTDIRYALENYEPRINIINISVEEQNDENTYVINIEYEIIQLARTAATSIILRVI